MANSVKKCKSLGTEISIVIGGGNLFRGQKLSQAGMDRVAGDHMGMLATVMNGIALRDALERAKVKTRVMSAIPISGLVEHFDRRIAIQLLNDGFVVILQQALEIHSLQQILLDVSELLRPNRTLC